MTATGELAREGRGGGGGPILAARGLRRVYGSRVALEGLSFEVARGEILGFLGPNGAGKTTAFHLLCGLTEPDAGEIELDGVRLSRRRPGLRARLGVVFQNPSLDVQLTGRENLELGAALHALPRAHARRRIAEALELVDLAGRADERVLGYSGGMKRRLELARVLLHDPDVLVLDEPTQGLDAAAAERVWRELEAIRRRRGVTVLLTTHDADEASRCDRILLLDRGALIAEGSPEALRARVGGDVVTVEGDDPEGIAARLAGELGLAPLLVGAQVVFEVPRAHEVIPRVVEAFERGRLRSVNMRPPSLADVFVRLTGRTLGGADARRAS